MLHGKKIVVGVTGGIAAYKVPGLVRALVKSGAEVFVIMTENAQRFVSPLVLSVLSGNPVGVDMFARNGSINHIDLARNADLFLIAPATANFLGKYANGIADDLLLTSLLATSAKVVVCPAMNSGMWGNSLVQANVSKLKGSEIIIIDPANGDLACGDLGPGRFPVFEQIIQNLYLALVKSSRLNGKKVLITAGATREYADPLRYLTNGSTGRMGRAFALVARAMGAKVEIVMGPRAVDLPREIMRIDVVSADDMKREVMARIGNADIFVATAAVCDFKFPKILSSKIKKEECGEISLVGSVDVLSDAARIKRNGQVFLGFALETEKNDKKVKEKMDKKALDYVVCDGPEAIASDYISGFYCSRAKKVEFDRKLKILLAEELLIEISNEKANGGTD